MSGEIDSSDRPLWVILASWGANHMLLERNVLVFHFPPWWIKYQNILTPPRLGGPPVVKTISSTSGLPGIFFFSPLLPPSPPPLFFFEVDVWIQIPLQVQIPHLILKNCKRRYFSESAFGWLQGPRADIPFRKNVLFMAEKRREIKVSEFRQLR